MSGFPNFDQLFYIQSQMNNDVLTVQGAELADLTPIVNQAMVTPPIASQLWYANNGYIYSALNAHVIDITKSLQLGVLINQSQNSTVTDNQQWTYTDDGYLQSNVVVSGGKLVADVKDFNRGEGATVIGQTKNVPPTETDNQHWNLVPLSTPS